MHESNMQRWRRLNPDLAKAKSREASRLFRERHPEEFRKSKAQDA